MLRGLIERVVIHRPADSSAEDGLQVEIVGEIVKMIELGLDAKKAALPREAACSVKVVAGAGNHRQFEISTRVCIEGSQPLIPNIYGVGAALFEVSTLI